MNRREDLALKCFIASIGSDGFTSSRTQVEHAFAFADEFIRVSELGVRSEECVNTAMEWWFTAQHPGLNSAPYGVQVHGLVRRVLKEDDPKKMKEGGWIKVRAEQ